MHYGPLVKWDLGHSGFGGFFFSFYSANATDHGLCLSSFGTESSTAWACFLVPQEDKWSVHMKHFRLHNRFAARANSSYVRLSAGSLGQESANKMLELPHFTLNRRVSPLLSHNSQDLKSGLFVLGVQKSPWKDLWIYCWGYTVLAMPEEQEVLLLRNWCSTSTAQLRQAISGVTLLIRKHSETKFIRATSKSFSI